MRFGTALLVTVAVVAPLSAATTKDGVDAWQRGDYGAAVKIWRTLAENGDADAAFDMGQAYKLGRGVPTDLKQAEMWYGKGAQAGHIQSAANYGLLLFQDGNRKSALPWIIKASDAGDPRAQYVYGTALFNGDLTARNWPKAYALMTRAAAAGLPQATTSLSQMDQYMSAQDRQKGLQMASQMATLPIPATGRQIVTGGEIRSFSPPPSRPTGDLSAPSARVARAEAAPAPPPPSRRPAPTARPQAPAHAAPAKASLASSGGRWMVQLGAFSSKSAAQSAWGKVSARLGGLRPSYEKAGAVIRLRAGPLADKGAAERACAAAKSAGAGCFPVAP